MSEIQDSVPSIFSSLLASGSSMAFCLALIPVLERVGTLFGLVDKPSLRKRHAGDIPLVGGIAIFHAVLLSGLLTSSSIEFFLPLLVCAILLIIGVIDDRYELRAIHRLPFQICAAFAMFYLGDVQIESIGNILGNGPIIFAGAVSIFFTVACTVGVINSINMIDGVDGLSGAIIFITILPLIYLNWLSGDSSGVLLLLSFEGAILGFLYFNIRLFRSKAKVFLGDAGSMVFGLVLVWYLIKLSQGHNAVLSPVAAGWIFGLPLADTVSVMVRRVVGRRSPFDADRNHLHHKIVDAGFSANQTVFLLIFIHSLFIAIGLVGNAYLALEPYLFWLFTIAVIGHYFFVDTLITFLAKKSKVASGD